MGDQNKDDETLAWPEGNYVQHVVNCRCDQCMPKQTMLDEIAQWRRAYFEAVSRVAPVIMVLGFDLRSDDVSEWPETSEMLARIRELQSKP